MKESELKILLDKFYKAEATPEEEERLKVYFSEEYSGGDYQAEKEYFRMISEVTELPSDGFEERIMAALPEDTGSARRIMPWIYSLTASAAAILFVLFAIPSIIGTGSSEPADTYTDPYLAYAETVKTLTLVSSTINAGMAAGKDGFSEINKVANGPLNTISELQKAKEMSMHKIKDINYIGKTTSIIRSENNDNNR